MTRSAPAIPLFGDAYMADTRHLTLEQHGAYVQLLMIAWRLPECALPNDDGKLARMLGVTPKKWAKLKPEIMAFWSLSEAGWQQKRLTKERRFVAEKSKQNADAANARWNGKSLKDNDGRDANALPDGCERNAPPPPPKSSEANASGGKPPHPLVREEGDPPPIDPIKALFDVGIAVLTSAGKTDREARSMIGKWRKQTGDDGKVLSALLDCRAKNISEPIEWIQRRFGSMSGYVSPSGFVYRGTPQQVMKEAERRNDMSTYWTVKGDIEGRARA